MQSNKPTPEPKPIFRLPISEQSPLRIAPTPLDTYRDLSGRLDLNVVVRSAYLYMGSGAVQVIRVENEDRSYYAFARRGGKLILPATGIKGAIRSIVEAISNSCVSQYGRGEEVDDGDEYNLGHERCRSVRRGGEGDAKLCPACRLFGVTGFRGRVHFSDGVPVSKVQSEVVKIGDLWQPHIARGRKFYENKRFNPPDNEHTEEGYRFIEAVPFKTVFQTSLFFENASPAELSLLLHALGIIVNLEAGTLQVAFLPKVGGGKPRCLGAVLFQPTGVWLMPAKPSDLLAALAGSALDSPDPGSTLRSWLADESLLDHDAWERFAQGAAPQSTLCPKELY